MLVGIGTGMVVGCGSESGEGGVTDAQVDPPADAHGDAGCTETPLVVFLNRNGGDYTQGMDNASTNVSGVLPEEAQTIPPATFDATVWADIVACMADRLAPFNIELVETDPGAMPHREVVFVDSLTQAGFPSGVGGAAADRCPTQSTPDPLERGVVIVAGTTTFGNDARAICENALLSLGITFYLDHTPYEADLMSVLPNEAPKRFLDMDVSCGEFSERDCRCGGSKQNSYQHLLAHAGPRCE